MSVSSVRLHPADEAWLRKRKLSIGTFVRNAVHQAIRLQEIEEAEEWMAQHRFRSGVDSVEFFRRDRESH